MSIIKSSLDAIGSGAGVAWPFFGIVFSSLGLVAGSTVALVTGSIAGFLFCAVAGGIFYLSYQNIQNKQKSLQEKKATAQTSLDEFINAYLQAINHEYEVNCDHEKQFYTKEKASKYINEQISSHLQTVDPAVMPLMHLLLSKLLTLNSFDFLTARDDQTIHQLTSKLIDGAPKTTISNATSLKAAFLGAVGAFGAIAGCTAGFVGLLSGLGLFTGFAAAPVVGWTALMVALGFAVLVGFNSARLAASRHEIKEQRDNINILLENLDARHVKKQITTQPHARPRGYPFFRAPAKDAGTQTDVTPTQDAGLQTKATPAHNPAIHTDPQLTAHIALSLS